MVLNICIGEKQITFGNDEIKQLLGINEISHEDINNVKKLKKFVQSIINKGDKIKFKDKKIYNQIKFYKYIGIKLTIKYDNLKNKTWIIYNGIKIHQCHKTIEVYFNFLILSEFEKSDKFNYLFYEDSRLFNENEIEIDMCNNCKSKERFDMKIKIDENKSFALECFEKHHENKYDNNYLNEIIRLLHKKYIEIDVRYIVIFWYSDITNLDKFREKFNTVVKQYDIHIKTKKDYCIEKLNKDISNKKLCSMIYSSYKNKNEPIVKIKNINELFNFKKNKKKEYLNFFISKLKNVYTDKQKVMQSQTNNSDDLDFLESDSDLDGSSQNNDSCENDDIESLKDHLNKFYSGDMLTFGGFTHYIHGLAYGDFLENEVDKFNIIEWFDKILYSLIKSFENAYDDLESMSYENKIFGLNN